MPKPPGLDADVREFFSLPIPHEVWESTKHLRDCRVIEYVDGLIDDDAKRADET